MLQGETFSFRAKVTAESFPLKQLLLINRTFDKVQDNFTRPQTLESLTDTAVLNDVRKQTLLQPYAVINGCTLVNSLKTHLKKTVSSNVEAHIVYTGSKFNVDDKAAFEEQHSLSPELFVLPTTTLRILLGRLPDV